MSSPAHEWTKREREGWSVCSRCGMVRNYDRETTTCSGALPKIRQRSEICASRVASERRSVSEFVQSNECEAFVLGTLDFILGMHRELN